MAASSDVLDIIEQYCEATTTVSEEAADVLESLIRSMDTSDYVTLKEEIFLVYLRLVEEYGQANSGLSCVVYDTIRSMSESKGTFSAVPQVFMDEGKLRGDVANAMESLWQRRDFEKCVSNMRGSMIERVENAARESMAVNAVEDRKATKTKVAFGIKSSPGCCRWCSDKDTRGEGRYKTADTAKRTFHQSCHCNTFPVFY